MVSGTPQPRLTLPVLIWGISTEVGGQGIVEISDMDLWPGRREREKEKVNQTPLSYHHSPEKGSLLTKLQ